MNLKVAEKLERLQEEGITLAKFFLPYLELSTESLDYLHDYEATLFKVLRSLSQYFDDTEEDMTFGFFLLTINYKPDTLHHLMKKEKY